MANNVLTHQMIAREAAAILQENMPFCSNVNRAREDEFVNAAQGYKKGQSVTIKLPPTGVVYDGATFAGGGAAPDFQEQQVTLTLSSQKHVPLTFTAKEKLLNITDFKERILMPQMATLAGFVEADVIRQAVQATPNLVGTPGTTPSSMRTFGLARQKLQLALAPASPRWTLMTSEANVELVDSSKTQFNPTKAISDQYLNGYIGEAQGSSWAECVNMPSIANGTNVTGLTVNGAGQTGNTLSIAGTANGQTFLKGQVFTAVGAVQAHPLTGNSQLTLRQFVVTADTTATGTTVSLPIYPPIDTAMPNQTVTASPTNGGAITFSGAASTSYAQSLTFQRDAYTLAFAPLPILASCEGYTYNAKGFSVRVMTFGNGQTDTESTRVDVLYGFAGVRPEHGCRIVQ